MSHIKRVLFAIVCFLSFVMLLPLLMGEEVDRGLTIIDREPWKVSWIEEGKNWILTANFDKGTLKTYFKDAPPEKGYGLSSSRKPSKQEFEFYSGEKFTSTDFQYEQWPDGAKAYAFKYGKAFEREGKKLEFSTTALIEEVEETENEIRYALLNFGQSSPDDEMLNQKASDHKSLSELPEFEQLVHKSLSSKLKLLMIHTDFIHTQIGILLDFMKVLEHEKNNDGCISETRLIYLLNQSNFPKISEMLPEIEKIKDDFFISNKVQDLIELIKKNNVSDVDSWFAKFENEILKDIEDYEQKSLTLPQYKYILNFYTEACQSRLHASQLMKLMNPQIFN